MSIHPASANPLALPTVFAPAAKVAPATDAANAAKKPAAQDADGDLQKDLATGENPYPSVGSNVNTKA